jgi:hypothetical protein
MRALENVINKKPRGRLIEKNKKSGGNKNENK